MEVLDLKGASPPRCSLAGGGAGPLDRKGRGGPCRYTLLRLHDGRSLQSLYLISIPTRCFVLYGTVPLRTCVMYLMYNYGENLFLFPQILLAISIMETLVSDK